MPLINPLDALFRDIKRELWLQEQAEHKEKAQKPFKPKQSTYANPLNWKAGRFINLVHDQEGSLGLFIEYFHKSNPTCRRLLPAPQSLTLDCEKGLPPLEERVHGEWWLHSHNSAPLSHEESEEEIQAIISRFNELINQYLEDSE